MKHFRVTLWKGKKAEKTFTVKGTDIIDALNMNGHGGLMVCEINFQEIEISKFEQAINEAANESQLSVIVLVDGEQTTLREFLRDNTEEPGVNHITQEQANNVIALKPGEFTMIGISQIRRIDGMEMCWECTGSGIMSGNYPCKVCNASGYIKKEVYEKK